MNEWITAFKVNSNCVYSSATRGGTLEERGDQMIVVISISCKGKQLHLTGHMRKLVWQLVGANHASSFLSLPISLFASVYLLSISLSVSLLIRPKDHRRRPDPVGKEAVGRHDPHRFLPQRLRPHWPAALYGQLAA